MATSDDDLLQRYADPEADPDYQANLAGVGQLAASAATGIGAQSARGLAMLQGQPSDFHGVPLGDAGQRLLRTAAPGFEPVSNLADSIADAYGQSVNTNAGLASKYLGAPAGAGVAAAGAVLPNFVGPAGEEKAIADAAAESIAHAAPGRVLDGLTPSALEREGVAATRGAEPPEPPGGITYSISKATDVGHPTAGLIGFHPDAFVSDAHTTNGEHVGRIVMEPSADGSMLISRGGGNGMMEWGNDAIVHPDYRGQGIGPNLVQNGIDHAHLNGMDFGSDTKLSQGGLNMYKKLESEGYPLDYNPTVVTEGDPQNGGYYASQNGQPAVVVRQPIHADDAHPDETPAPQASGWIQNQAGEAGMPSYPGDGSMLNIGLHQGQEGQPGFRQMSPQEAQGAVESTGAGVTKVSLLTPQQHGVSEPTAVLSTDRALSEPEMQHVLAQTQQSAIPQRTNNGVESMHIAPGHEEIAQREGWDKFNPAYFRDHDGNTAPTGSTHSGSSGDLTPPATHSSPDAMAAGGAANGVDSNGIQQLTQWAEGGAVDDIPPEAHTLVAHIQAHGSAVYDPRTGDVEPISESHMPVHLHEISATPSAKEIHEHIMGNRELMDGINLILAGTHDGKPVLGIVRKRP